MIVAGRGAAFLGAVLAVGPFATARPAAAQERPATITPLPRARPQEQPTIGDLTSESDPVMGEKLQRVLRVHGADIYGCYGVALSEKPRLAGELLVRMFVLPGGTVERAEILKDDAGSKRLAECLTESMRTWKVEELAGDTKDQVVFPLVFRPEAAGSTAAVVTRVRPKPLRFVVPLAEGKPGPLGQGRVEARVLVDETTVGSTQASLTHLTLHPTMRLALHTHPASTELLYVLKGLARVRDATGALVIANTGDVIVSSAKRAHNIESAPLASLTLLQFFVPGGPEHAYRDPKDRAGTIAAGKVRAGGGAPGGIVKVVKGAEATSYSILGGKAEVALLLDGVALGEASLQRFEAAAGAEVPAHVHAQSDEILYVVSGRGEMTVGGLVLPVAAGDAIHIPMSTEHALKVIEKLVAVQCYAPGGPEQRFKEKPQDLVAPASSPSSVEKK